MTVQTISRLKFQGVCQVGSGRRLFVVQKIIARLGKNF